MMRTFTRLAILAVCLFALAHTILAQQERRYAVLMMGKLAGAQTSIVEPNGVREFAFEFNDRGRGPKITSRIKLDIDGLPVSLETSGSDYLKAPVDEKLTVVDGVAHWKNTAEAGDKKIAKAFYISMNGAPEEFALLAQALLKSPNKRLPLLPEGEASIERTG